MSHAAWSVCVCVCCVCVQLVAVLREVKYLLIRNMEEIPASASQLYANNDTLLMYVAHLDLTVAWYNKIRETVLEVEYPIIEAQLTAIDAQLRQAEETLDWQTDGKIFLSLFLSVSVCLSVCLQCFDAVGWAAGRASGL